MLKVDIASVSPSITDNLLHRVEDKMGEVFEDIPFWLEGFVVPMAIITQLSLSESRPNLQPFAYLESRFLEGL